MSNILDVAKYILKYCQDNQIHDCSNKKLQKLMYYNQAWSLALRNKVLFKANIEAWLHGPVVKEIYHKYKSFGFSPITENLKDFDVSVFADDDINLMNTVLDQYAKFDAGYLELRTHIERPWLEARKNSSTIITTQSMRDYYGKVLEDNAAKQSL